MTTFDKSLAVHVVNATPEDSERRHTRRVKLARKIVDAALTAAFVAFAVAVWVYYLTEPGQ